MHCATMISYAGVVIGNNSCKLESLPAAEDLGNAHTIILDNASVSIY